MVSLLYSQIIWIVWTESLDLPALHCEVSVYPGSSDNSAYHKFLINDFWSMWALTTVPF